MIYHLRKVFLLFLVIASLFTSDNFILAHDSPQEISSLFAKQNPRHIFLTPDNKPTPLLIELLTLDGIYDPNDSLHDIVAKTQDRWIAVRQGKYQIERSDLIDSKERCELKENIIDVASRMGLFSERRPLLNHYDYGVCLGAFLSGVRSRLAHLVQLWNEGIRFDSLVFLVGERTLRKESGQQDDFATLCDPAKSPLPFKPNWIPPSLDQITYETEYDMAKLVWDQVCIPEDMRIALEDRVFFVDAPRGNAARPSTGDTYRHWLKEFSPRSHSTIIAASDPLVWSYQQITGNRILSTNYLLDTVAPQATIKDFTAYHHSLVSLIFDTVAKSLYDLGDSVP